MKDLGIFLSQKKAEDEEPHGGSTLDNQTLAGLLTPAIINTGPKLCNWTVHGLCNRELVGYRLFNSRTSLWQSLEKSRSAVNVCDSSAMFP